jgi:hypothetical protein
MGLLRTLMFLVVATAFVYVGATVTLGNRTLFGHIGNIWAADETQELVDGVKQASGPAVDKVKRGFEAGLEEARRDDSPDAGIQATP